MKSSSLINSHYLVGVALATTVLAWIGGTTRPSMAAQFFDITAVETGSLIDLPGSQTINGITYEGQTLPITGITANGASYSLNTLPTPQLILRRSGAGEAPNRQVVWSERPNRRPETTVRIAPPTTTQSALEGNNFFAGTDNLFVNARQNAGNLSDVERVDFIVSSGFRVNPSQGAIVMERGSRTSHDDFQIAAITGLDSSGIPNQFGELLRVSNWGRTDLRVNSQNPPPNPRNNPTYTVLNNTGVGGAFTDSSSIRGQNIGGVLVPFTGLVPENTEIFGWALFGSDVDPMGDPNNLVNWTNDNVYPQRSPERVTQGGNGIDLLAANVGVVAKENLLRLFKIEGRAGVLGFEDFEFAIGEKEAPPSGVIYRDWIDGEIVPWSLMWNPDSKRAAFTVDGQTIDYISPIDVTNPIFNLYTLTVYSRLAEGKVDAGTMIELTVNMINGEGIDPIIVNSMAGSAELDTFNSGLVDGITSMSGSVEIDWPNDGLNPNEAKARSRVGFFLEGYDPPVTSAEQVSEPGILLGLLSVGGLGLINQRKKQN